MILHLQEHHSSSKAFLKDFRLQFPNKNIVVCFHEKEDSLTMEKEGVETLYRNTKEFVDSFDFSIVSIVVVHLLDYKKELFLYKYIPKNISIVWWMYGGDLYRRLWLKGYKLYAPQTLPFLKTKTKGIIGKTRFFGASKYAAFIDKKILKRIIGVIPCEHPDYELACKLLGRKVDHIDIYPRGGERLPDADGNDICIGHSASRTSNHLYALDILKKVDTGDSRIVLPLSYTIQDENYRQAVVEKYKQVFGEKFHPIFDYQDKNTYVKGFQKYKVAIYPNWRQEALGNIFICFKSGVKVFLSVNNPCLEYFKELGYCVYTLENINSAKDLSPLTPEEREQNRLVYQRIKEERAIKVPLNIKSYFSKFV